MKPLKPIESLALAATALIVAFLVSLWWASTSP